MKIRCERKWDIFKALFDPFFKYFCLVVTLLIVINWGSTWSADEVWTLDSEGLELFLLMALLGILPSFLANVFIETDSAKGVRLKKGLIFVITSLLVLGVHQLYASSDAISLGVILIFLAIYGGIYVYASFNATTIELKEKETAMAINERLNEIHRDENETHPH